MPNFVEKDQDDGDKMILLLVLLVSILDLNCTILLYKYIIKEKLLVVGFIVFSLLKKFLVTMVI